MNSVIISNTWTCLLAAVALLSLITAFVIKNNIANICLCLVSFICFLACVTYALLLGAQLNELLLFVLIFTLSNMIVFIPKNESNSDSTTKDAEFKTSLKSEIKTSSKFDVENHKTNQGENNEL